jgi:hypothetical protein
MSLRQRTITAATPHLGLGWRDMAGWRPNRRGVPQRPRPVPIHPRITGDLEEVRQGLEEITRELTARDQPVRWSLGLFVGGQRVVAMRQEHDRAWWWISRNQDVRELIRRLEVGGAATVALAAPDDMDPETGEVDRAGLPRIQREFSESVDESSAIYFVPTIRLHPPGGDPENQDYVTACARRGVPYINCYPVTIPGDRWVIDVTFPPGVTLTPEEREALAIALERVGIPGGGRRDWSEGGGEESLLLDDLSFYLAAEALQTLHEITGALQRELS